MGGGGGATANNTLTFEDTSEFIFRNSSTDRSGFHVDAQYTDENIGKVTDLTDNQTETTELLDQACRDLIKQKVEAMLAVADDTTINRDYLKDNALKAWDRACNLYPEYQLWSDDTVADILAEGVERICENKTQWSRIAGSSLNCVVQSLEVRAQTELSRKLFAERSRWRKDMLEHQTQAIRDAFEMEMAARMNTAQIPFTSAVGLLQVLRGAEATGTVARTTNEVADTDVQKVFLGGRYWVDAQSVSDDQGAYLPRVDENRATANAVRALVGV